MTDHYAYIAAYATHVNFGLYYGSHLSGDVPALEGKGRNLRHIKVRTADAATLAPLRALVHLALKERRRALAAAGPAR